MQKCSCYVLLGEYLSAVSKIEGFAAPVVRALIPFGLNVPQSGARMGGLSLDAMKFFLKQQQKALEDNQGLEKAGEREKGRGGGGGGREGERATFASPLHQDIILLCCS